MNQGQPDVEEHLRSVAAVMDLSGEARTSAAAELKLIAYRAEKLINKGDMKHGHVLHQAIEVIGRLKFLASAIEERNVPPSSDPIR